MEKDLLDARACSNGSNGQIVKQLHTLYYFQLMSSRVIFECVK